MIPEDAARLLAVCASFDNRKPDPDTAMAWSVVMGDMRFEDCRDAVVAHYQKSREWIMPADIRSAVKRLRAKRLASAGDPTPPPDLTPLETIAWVKERNRRVANGEHVDTDGGRVLEARNLPELRAFIARGPQILEAPARTPDRPRAFCEAQTTEDGGVVICGDPATSTAMSDTGRPYPTCADHEGKESA